MNPTNPITRRATAASLAVAVIGAVAISGCGGSSNAASNTNSDVSRQKARAQFQNCLRQHGAQVTTSQNGGVDVQINRNTPAFQSALKACQGYLRKAFGNVTPAQRAQFRQAAVKFTACLRAHGQNVPDPTFNDGPSTSTSSGGGGQGVKQVFAGVDRNTPAFQAAVKACQSNLPKPPGGAVRIGIGGPGGPPPGGPGGGPGAAPAPGG